MNLRLTVYFRACVQDALFMMSESCKIRSIFLALELLCMLPFLAIVDLQSIVGAANYGEFTCIVKVYRCDFCMCIVGLESLFPTPWSASQVANGQNGELGHRGIILWQHESTE
jgi:hypothetical protein